MAPEVLNGEIHSYSVDYYALGVIVYECMYGYRPYIAKTKRRMKEIVMSRQVEVGRDELPDGWDEDARHFVNGLMRRKAEERLGNGGIGEIVAHGWMRNVDWEGMRMKKLKAEFLPGKGDNFDRKYCLLEKEVGLNTQERYLSYVNDEQFQKMFCEFSMVKVRNVENGKRRKQSKTIEDVNKMKLMSDNCFRKDNEGLLNKCNNTYLLENAKDENKSIKISRNDAYIDIHNLLRFTYLNNDNILDKKSSCYIKKDTFQKSKFMFFNPSSKEKKCMKINHNKSNIGNDTYKREFPLINKSLRGGEVEKERFLKKVLQFKRNDNRYPLSMRFQHIYKKKMKENESKIGISNSLILNQRPSQNGFVFLRKNKSCNNIANNCNNISSDRNSHNLNYSYKNGKI